MKENVESKNVKIMDLSNEDESETGIDFSIMKGKMCYQGQN